MVVCRCGICNLGVCMCVGFLMLVTVCVYMWVCSLRVCVCVGVCVCVNLVMRLFM